MGRRVIERVAAADGRAQRFMLPWQSSGGREGPWVKRGLSRGSRGGSPWRGKTSHPETHVATASRHVRPRCVLLCISHAQQPCPRTAPPELARGTSRAWLHLEPRDNNKSNKPQISGQKLIPSWGREGGCQEKRSLRYVPFLFLARFPKEMRCLQSSPLSCLSPSIPFLNTSLDLSQT